MPKAYDRHNVWHAGDEEAAGGENKPRWRSSLMFLEAIAMEKAT
jgi:hypothetical protein